MIRWPHCSLALALSAAACAVPSFGEPLLNPVFQDHAVLQRDQPIRLWGTAAAGSKVEVTLGSAKVSAKADKTGAWHANVPAMAAGGPYTLKVTGGKESQEVSDLLIGDVYLCSGQSNMAYRVMEAIDAGPEIQASTNDSIRLMTVANVTKPTPQKVLPLPVTWSAANPKAVTGFSAACYFFGRDLQKSVHVPLGLIHDSWAGANITAFMSAEGLSKTQSEAQRLSVLKLYGENPDAAIAQWGKVIEGFWTAKGQTPWRDTKADPSWKEAPKDLGIWTLWSDPALKDFAGHVWFRTSITLSAAEAADANRIGLGTITEEDATWINGTWLAGSFGYGQVRDYALPQGLLHEGQNEIVLNVYCGWKGCGMFGPSEARAITLKDGRKLPLTGPWKYQVVPASVGTSPRVPWGATAGITMAYNAMIAPLASYGLKGVLWYQGESNTGAASQYRDLLKDWMEDWRKAFAAPELPFLIVQLPDYGLPPFKPEESDWAQLRESQRLAVAADPHAALAVTIDIGDHMGLHPSNKQEVGRRLSLAAQRLIYKDASIQSGPLPQSAIKVAGSVTISFSGVNGSLKAVSGDAPIGFELCGAGAGSCRFVSAAIDGNSVHLTIPAGLDAKKVRYCWGDGPVCTLYDEKRLPAVPFEMEVGGAR